MSVQKILVTLLVGCTLAALGCAKRDLTEERNELNLNRTKWQQQNISSYSIFAIQSCYCKQNDLEVLISVENNVINFVKDSGRAGQARFSVDPADVANHVYPTIDELFTKIEKAIGERAETLEVTYDETYGYPSKLVIDYSKNSMDDEITIKIRPQILSQ
ncbi:MAG: DUF6174 domain-containing protein [Gammaproteobacteria bacterium]|nr:DUF6174 domain-containing protein [Gammaproteobacteria bacterium]